MCVPASYRNAPCFQGADIVALPASVVKNTTIRSQKAMARKRLHGCGKPITRNGRSMPFDLFVVFASLWCSARFYDCVIDDLYAVRREPLFPLLLITYPSAIPKK